MNRAFLQSLASAPALPLPGIPSLRILRMHLGSGSYATGRSVSDHQHEMLQLQYVLSGRFRFETEAGPVELVSGRGLVILPGLRHGWQCCAGGVMAGMTVSLRRDALTSESLRPLTQVPVASFSGPDARRVMEEIFATILAPQESCWREEELGCRLGLWLVAALEEAWPGLARSRPPLAATPAKTLCERADAFIHANLHHPISIEDIASEAGLSGRHMNRLYRRHRGMSVGQAICRARLERGEELLVNHPDMPVKTIAYRCGFSGPAYFSACFRKHFECTPSERRAT